MVVIAEVAPRRRLERFLDVVGRAAAYADVIDIPDAPVGSLSGSAVVDAVVARRCLGVEVLPHVRVIDFAVTGLLNLAFSARAAGVWGLVLLRGDPLPGSITASSEDAARIMRERVPGLRVGGLLSMRYSVEDILRRVGSEVFDFFLVLRVGEASEEKLEAVREAARRAGLSLYPYVIVETARNAELVGKLLKGQGVVSVGEAQKRVEELLSLFDGVVVSVPGDDDALLQLLKRITGR